MNRRAFGWYNHRKFRRVSLVEQASDDHIHAIERSCRSNRWNVVDSNTKSTRALNNSLLMGGVVWWFFGPRLTSRLPWYNFPI